MIKVVLTERDYKYICNADYIPWEEIKDSCIYITGGTGLLGKALIKSILFVSKEKNLSVKVIALVRNIEKAKATFFDELKTGCLTLIEGLVEKEVSIEDKVDYVIHGASITSSKMFVEKPVETIQTAIVGTINTLNLAVKKQVKGFLYLSSMEVYGYPNRGHIVAENEIGSFSPFDVRNSYCISKETCEAMSYAYLREFNLPIKIARLVQVIGREIDENDNRITAYIARCIKNKEDIVLKTEGRTERSYIYIADAITGLLTILLKGSRGETFNVASEGTYCSILDMAEQVAKTFGIRVRIEVEDSKEDGYLSTLYMNLNTDKLKSMGWKAMKTSVPLIYQDIVME